MLKKKFKDGTHIPSIYFGSQFYTTNACLLYFFLSGLLYIQKYTFYTLCCMCLFGVFYLVYLI